jgi:preprotein translocase subunit SecE
VDRIRTFLEETRSELQKVTWPTPRQTANLTVIVFAVGAAVGVYIFFWDAVLLQVTGFITSLGGAR